LTVLAHKIIRERKFCIVVITLASNLQAINEIDLKGV
jgi:hypothetical protein